jgi:hypothetical protein
LFRYQSGWVEGQHGSHLPKISYNPKPNTFSLFACEAGKISRMKQNVDDRSQTNHLLGYPADARLLIVNADDFGMCHAVNEAIIRALREGLVRSTSLMVPCPWALQAMHFLKGHHEVPFGVHLTAISEWPDYRWGPVTSREKVPTLVGQTGYFYSFERMPEFLEQVKLDQLEAEFKAQIETVLAAGLKPDHLDWHALRINTREDILDFRVVGSTSINKVRSQGLPCNDHDFLDSYLIESAGKPALYARLLHDLPAGLSEWAAHPGIDHAELLAIETGSKHERWSDFDFWTSQQAKETIQEEKNFLG